jgi:hypothetical protein
MARRVDVVPERGHRGKNPSMALSSRVRLLLVLPMALAPAHAVEWRQAGVAVIESLSGEASVRAHSTKNRIAAVCLEWLPAESTIEVGAKSSAILILLNGSRYELGPGAKATVSAESLGATKGPVRRLDPLPPMPRAAPIVGNPTQIAGAARIRGSNLRGLYPRDGMAVLPASAKLSFQAVPGASSYHVEVDDEEGSVLLDGRTESTELAVLDGTLKAGRRYSWRVEAFSAAGVIARGAAAFVTISEEDLERRAVFAKAAEAGDQAFRTALLADVDFRLGLLREARDGFVAALRLKPNEVAIQHALELVQSALAGEAGR